MCRRLLLAAVVLRLGLVPVLGRLRPVPALVQVQVQALVLKLELASTLEPVKLGLAPAPALPRGVVARGLCAGLCWMPCSS